MNDQPAHEHRPPQGEEMSIIQPSECLASPPYDARTRQLLDRDASVIPEAIGIHALSVGDS